MDAKIRFQLIYLIKSLKLSGMFMLQNDGIIPCVTVFYTRIFNTAGDPVKGT